MGSQLCNVWKSLRVGLAFAIALHVGLVGAAGPGYWDAKKLAESSSPYMKLLDGDKQVVATVSTAQMRALMDVKERSRPSPA